MKGSVLLVLALTVATAVARAADVTVTPPPGGGFAVNSSTGAPIRFRVGESGEIYIQSLPSILAGKPLCWEQETGLLRPCPRAAGTDFTRPVIGSDAPAIASAYQTSFNLTYSDDVELASRNTFGSSSNETVRYFDEGTTSEQSVETVNVPLGTTFKRVYFAADTSGNFSKRTVSISTPPVAISFGTYQVLASTIPPNYRCSITGPAVTSPTTIRIYVSSFDVVNQPYPALPTRTNTGKWTNGDGFRVGITVLSGQIPSQLQILDTYSSSLHPLTATEFPLDSLYGYQSGSGTTTHVGFTGHLRYVASSPARIELALMMKCNVNNEGWVYGGTMSFLAELS